MDKQLTTIYIIRHGETEHNVNEIIQGQADSSLTELGEEQAKYLASEFKDIHFDAIFSSDLFRAKRTAEIISIERQLAVNTTKLLRERSYGVYEGRPVKDYFAENRAMFEKLKTLSEEEKRAFRIYSTQETNVEIVARMLTFLREIAVAFTGKTVLAVSHGSIMRALLMHLGYATYDELPGRSIENTGYIKLESDGIDFFIKELKGVNKVK